MEKERKKAIKYLRKEFKIGYRHWGKKELEDKIKIYLNLDEGEVMETELRLRVELVDIWNDGTKIYFAHNKLQKDIEPNNNHLLMSHNVYPASWDLDRWQKEKKIAIKYLEKIYGETFYNWSEQEKSDEITEYLLTKYGKNGKFYTEETTIKEE